MSKRTAIILIVSTPLLLIGASFYSGWMIRDKYFPKPPYVPTIMRLSGFSFTKPLLICDVKSERRLPQLRSLETNLINFIEEQKLTKNVDSVSVYFQDFKTDGRIDINKDEKFAPASLTKIPVMIAVLKKAEMNPDFLSKKISYTGEDDFNTGQEIQPSQTAKAGQTHTVGDLLEKMIRYSDNNSLRILESLLSESELKYFFDSLQLPFPVSSSKPEEFNSMTTKDASYFFRILYNATYLEGNLSDRALEILSQTDYQNGIMAGLPNDVKVSHKFGLETFTLEGKIQSRELNDCGIVYHPSNPYLLCIMTKTSSSIQTTENIIKDISSIVYDHVESYSK